MACRAVLDAVRAWHKAGNGAVADLLQRIEPLWLERIAPSIARDCAATCLFALAHSRGQVHVAAIGDGMALLRTKDGRLEWVVGPRASGFSNETDEARVEHLRGRIARFRERSAKSSCSHLMGLLTISFRTASATSWFGS